MATAQATQQEKSPHVMRAFFLLQKHQNVVPCLIFSYQEKTTKKNSLPMPEDDT
jgi:hypothetical protein